MKAISPSSLEWHKRYDNVDGTGEMFLGAMLLGIALLSYLQSILKDSIWVTHGFARLIFMYAVLASVMGPAFLLRRISKRRFTFPRTGYVALGMGAHHNAKGTTHGRTRFKRSRRIAIVAIMGSSIRFGVAMVCLIGFGARHLEAIPCLPILCDVAYLGMWVLGYGFLIARIGGPHRWKWFLLLFMAVGLILIGILHTGSVLAMSRPVSLFVGLIWVTSGIGTFFSYLRHTHPPAAEIE